MRQILSQEEIEAKQKRRNIIISIILLGIMLLSTAGFAFIYNSDDTSGSSANSSLVQNVGDKWQADIGGAQLLFSNPPSVTNQTKGALLMNVNQYYNKPLYIDSDSEAIFYEIYSTLGQYAQRVQHACYSSCENSSYPQKGCDSNLIVYNENLTNSLYQNNSCVFISGDMRAVDAFLYRTFGLA